MKSRKDNNDIENEARHSKHDQSPLTRFAPRQRPMRKEVPRAARFCFDKRDAVPGNFGTDPKED
jgi:hypothetical protein